MLRGFEPAPGYAALISQLRNSSQTPRHLKSLKTPGKPGVSLEYGARIHPQYANEFETAFAVSWPDVPWNPGSWRSETGAALQALAALRQPDDRVHFAGDYMTGNSSWMQGAFESARETAVAVHKRALARN
jgi:monoamine oxidase